MVSSAPLVQIATQNIGSIIPSIRIIGHLAVHVLVGHCFNTKPLLIALINSETAKLCSGPRYSTQTSANLMIASSPSLALYKLQPNDLD